MSVSPSPNPSPSAPGGLTALTHPLIHAGPQPACVPSSPWSDSSRSQLSISWLSHPGLGLEVVRGLPCAQRQEGPVSPQGTRILLPSLLPPPVLPVGAHTPSSPSTWGTQLHTGPPLGRSPKAASHVWARGHSPQPTYF